MCFGNICRCERGECRGSIEGLYELFFAGLEDDIERHLDKAALCFGAEDCVTLH
jgi:hypothetical protein